MSKATPATTSASSPAPHAGRTRGRTAPGHRKPRCPARPASTQDLIARIWDTLEWRKTLQIAFTMVIADITIFAVLVGLELFTRATGLAAAWPAGVSITITATVTYRGVHRQRR